MLMKKTAAAGGLYSGVRYSVFRISSASALCFSTLSLQVVPLSRIFSSGHFAHGRKFCLIFLQRTFLAARISFLIMRTDTSSSI